MTAIKRSIGISLMLCMLIVLFAATAINIFAADEITVNIVSFTRGEQEDLRSSELLEARVTGYDGNVRELTYEWTNGLGTYLYVYNSHNMYGINNTDGEIEIYNSNVSSSANMSGRSYKDTFKGTGYAWAAVYGAGISSSSLVGTVTVKVYAPDGTLLATDSHVGERVKTGGYLWWATYENHGFVESNLDDDVQSIAFGMFEGDTKNVKILLGESSIVHITCAECTISEAEVVSGEDLIEIVVDEDSGEYHISSVTGVEDGVAEVQISIKKGNCKFHQNYTSTRTIKVYVYNKPTTTSTATAIMLDNLDANCEYYIGGVEGQKQTVDGKEYVVFENLTPNTEYQIEVVGQAENTDPVYAYVYETTKPAHVGTVEVLLNGTYNTSTGEATGTRVDISTVMPSVETLYLRYEDSEIYFPLKKTAMGVYSTELSDGNYTIYYSTTGSDEKIQLSDQTLTISGASRTRELFFNSVTYDTDGGTPAIATEYYLVDSKVQVSDIVPVKEGYLFTHWVCQDNHKHVTGDVISEAIGKEYNLVAQYVASADVYVNITIKHIAEENGSHNNDSGIHNITFTVDQRFGSEGDYTELISKTVEWDGKSAYTGNDFEAEYVNSDTEHKDRTIYTALEPTLVNVAKDAEYTFTSAKSGYELVSVTSELDDNGDWQIYAELIFKPNDFDFTFTVELDEKSKKVADELKPVSVNVKVTAWGNATYDDTDDILWYTISQHKDTYERIVLDKNGKGTGTYPVWIADANGAPYYYRIEVVSYETADGTILPAIDKNKEHITYATAQNRYSAEIEVADGKDPDTTDAVTLTGAYYDSTAKAQVGTVNALVTIDVFDVTFNPNGGTLDGSTGNKVLEYQIGIPNLNNYVPVREGGYVFDGWYIADESGNMTDEAAVSDTIIFKNTTLIAKWKEPLTIQGNIAVDATYYEHDSLSSIVVLLQKIDANGYAETVNYITAPITYDEDAEHGFGAYEFTGVEDNGHSYRIKTVATNYHTHYLNETSTADVIEYDKYAEETDDVKYYLAAFGDDTVANVHLHLHFMPESFDLQYAIDATAIGEDYRPNAAEVLVLCDTGEHIDPQHWAVISQMIDENGNYDGNATTLTNGSGTGSESVWKMKAEDNTPYHYSIRIDSLTFNNVDAYGDNPPYAIYYNGSARYSDVNDAPTQTLTATIVPRMYTVTFDLGAIKDVEGITVSGMDSYITLNNTLEDTYYWSRGKAVTAAPSVEGYTFLGWYDGEGENATKVTAVSAASAGNITLYAKWTVTPAFAVLADAGYYSETRNSETQEGVISFNARITNFEEVKSYISSFGMYIYDTTGNTLKVDIVSTAITQLETDSGEFHALVTDIATENFSKNVLAAPYVVVNGEIIMGKTMTVSVSKTNKWLGPKN